MYLRYLLPELPRPFSFPPRCSVFTLFRRASEVKRLEERLPTYGTLRFEQENISGGGGFLFFFFCIQKRELNGGG